MINLAKNSGLDIGLDLEKLELVFGKNIVGVKADIRLISQMQEVLMDAQAGMPEELYYMYRGIFKAGDGEKIASAHLRYDITVIKPGFLGAELIKTAGHYHPNAYPELYEVVWGEVFCLLQRPDKDDFTKIDEVILVKAKAKEKIVIPPNYGHILINASSEAPVVMANWVYREFNPDYSLYRKAKGAAYFLVNNDGEIAVVKNKFFSEIAELRTVRPRLPLKRFGLSLDEPIYNILKEAEKLDFLRFPEKYDYQDCFFTDKTLFAAVIS